MCFPHIFPIFSPQVPVPAVLPVGHVRRGRRVVASGGRCHLGGRHGGVARGRARGRANQAAQGGMGDNYNNHPY